MYSVDGQKFEPDELGLQPVLERAYRNHVRPMCLCSLAPIPVYITCLGGTFVLKRMPCTGGRHAVDCLHYEPPEGLSGSADIAAAVSEDPDTGITNLDVEFSLSSGRSRPSSHGIACAVAGVRAARPRLSLRGLLQFLWDEAELTKWKPVFAGKRTWAVVRHHLLRAAANKVLKRKLLSNVLFVPESFTVAEKEQIAARRAHRLADGFGLQGPDHLRKMIVVAEIKEIVPSQSAFDIVLKHQPDLPFSIDAEMHRQLILSFKTELSLWGSAVDVHLMAAATFALTSGGQPMIDEMSLLPVSGQWIPADDCFELRLIDCLVRQGRSFQKSLQLNSKVPSLSPSAMLLDVDAAPVRLALDRYSVDGVDAAAVMEPDSAPEWVWRIRVGDLPAFPQQSLIRPHHSRGNCEHSLHSAARRTHERRRRA